MKQTYASVTSSEKKGIEKWSSGSQEFTKFQSYNGQLSSKNLFKGGNEEDFNSRHDFRNHISRSKLESHFKHRKYGPIWTMMHLAKNGVCVFPKYIQINMHMPLLANQAMGSANSHYKVVSFPTG